MHLRGRRELAQEVGADPESAGAAQRLHGYRTTQRDSFALGAEQQRLHGLVVRGDAVDRQVAARRRLVCDLALRALDAIEQRHLAVVVAIDTDAEVDLARIGIAVEGLGNAEDRIAGREIDGAEQ